MFCVCKLEYDCIGRYDWYIHAQHTKHVHIYIPVRFYRSFSFCWYICIVDIITIVLLLFYKYVCVFLIGGTFTISNGGVYGSLMGTPILNPPQSAILGTHHRTLRHIQFSHRKIKQKRFSMKCEAVNLLYVYLHDFCM